VTRSRRRLFAVAVAVATLAGCGGDDRKPDAAATPTPTSAVTTTTPAVATTPAATATTPKPKPTPSGKPTRTPDEDVLPGPEKIRTTAIPVGEVPRAGGPLADKQAVLRTLRAFLGAIRDGNGYKACAQFSKRGRSALIRAITKIAPETAGAPCEQSILLYTSGYGDAIDKPKVKDVRIDGTRATAVGPLNEKASLSKTGSLWLLDSYGNATGDG